MSAPGGYFSPYFTAIDLKQAVKAATVIRAGFSPRERKCGACGGKFTTTMIRSYFCELCWRDARHGFIPNKAR